MRVAITPNADGSLVGEVADQRLVASEPALIEFPNTWAAHTAEGTRFY